MCIRDRPTNPLSDLNNTRNTQICLFLVESILLDALKGNNFKPNYVAGHSLGEITALYCADVFSFEDCISLIKERSQLMVNAGQGSMAAVIGFDRNQLDLLVQKIGMAKQIENLPNTKERFNYASEIFERNLFEICELNYDPTNPLSAVSYTHLTLPTTLVV